MKITSAQYGTSELEPERGNTRVIATIDGVEMQVPLDPDNRHYAAILEWVAKGNTIQDAD
jgi:hypothetical protein|tara:strand:- start:1112 stop:1291 length:180 start_codon:yes stop_codon:yes gene_type:complete